MICDYTYSVVFAYGKHISPIDRSQQFAFCASYRVAWYGDILLAHLDHFVQGLERSARFVRKRCNSVIVRIKMAYPGRLKLLVTKSSKAIVAGVMVDAVCEYHRSYQNQALEKKFWIAWTCLNCLGDALKGRVYGGRVEKFLETSEYSESDLFAMTSKPGYPDPEAAWFRRTSILPQISYRTGWLRKSLRWDGVGGTRRRRSIRGRRGVDAHFAVLFGYGWEDDWLYSAVLTARNTLVLGLSEV
jgi:hypothetical protein